MTSFLTEMAAAMGRITDWMVESGFGSKPHTPLDRGPSHPRWCFTCQTEWPCAAASFVSLDVVVSEHLPVPPSPGENARRIVRHGLAHWLEWLGEDVGPAPGEPTHAFQAGRTLMVSRELRQQLRPDGPSPSPTTKGA